MRSFRLAISMVLFAACGPIIPGGYGDGCELNSDCDAPLVCRIGYCRVECTTSRDCAAGLDCVNQTTQDGLKLGGCQLPPEIACLQNSQCPMPLVCTMGECTNVCACPPGEPCRDCPPGASCIDTGSGGRACLDRAVQSCIWHSDCDASEDSFVCAPDQRCRIECRQDLDCRFGARCTPVMFEEPLGTVTGNFCVGER